MAIAPVNKFISVAVPVAPGLQKLYEVPTGTSALLLYVQVLNFILMFLKYIQMWFGTIISQALNILELHQS